MRLEYVFFFFFFNDTATTEIYTLSLHDALPISGEQADLHLLIGGTGPEEAQLRTLARELGVAQRVTFLGYIPEDRKSTRLNSSHGYISYAVFCLKKKKKKSTTAFNLTSMTL